MKINKNLIVEVINNCCNKIILCDNTGFGETGFLKEDEINNFQYKLSEVGIFTVVQSNLTSDTVTKLVDFHIVTTNEITSSNYNYSALVPPIDLNLINDGYYTIKYFAIPLNQPKFSTQINYYCNDCGEIFDYDNNNEKVEIECINFDYSNILSFRGEFVFFNNLKLSYINSMQDKLFIKNNGILSKKEFNNCFKPDISESLIGSALAAIRYLVDLCRYDEAQDIIERLSGCNGIYNNNNCNNNCKKSNNYGCGCS